MSAKWINNQFSVVVLLENAHKSHQTCRLHSQSQRIFFSPIKQQCVSISPQIFITSMSFQSEFVYVHDNDENKIKTLTNFTSDNANNFRPSKLRHQHISASTSLLAVECVFILQSVQYVLILQNGDQTSHSVE